MLEAVWVNCGGYRALLTSSPFWGIGWRNNLHLGHAIFLEEENKARVFHAKAPRASARAEFISYPVGQSQLLLKPSVSGEVFSHRMEEALQGEGN